MKNSTGIVVTVGEGDEKKAILQVRAQDDSFPGLSQVSVHGGLEDSESFLEGLLRESSEEIGEILERAGITEDIEIQFGITEGSLKMINKETKIKDGGKSKRIITFAGELEESDALYALLERLENAGVIKLVEKNDLDRIQSITFSPETKKDGVEDGEIGMFPDELEAVTKALS